MTIQKPILSDKPSGRFSKTTMITLGLLNLGASASARLRLPFFPSLIVLLLIASCSINRTPSKRSPDASVKPYAEDANRLRESNTIRVVDAGDSEDATHSQDVVDYDVTVTSNDSNSIDARPIEKAVIDGPPLIFATTDTESSINFVLSQGDMHQLQLQVRGLTQTQWSLVSDPTIRGDDIVQWRVRELSPSTEYEYRALYQMANDKEEVLYSGRIQTQRENGKSFTFCIFADSHVFVDDPDITGPELSQIAQNIEEEEPDFVIYLGDILDFHSFGFNRPPPESSWTKSGYLFYRDLVGELLGRTTHFAVIGNWEGENGDFTAEEIVRSRSQRLLYLPGPEPSTYPQGGSAYQDYYAFTWGDALFVVLNVMSFTPTGHYLSSDIDLPDDWTLGETQLLWLEETLKNSPTVSTDIVEIFMRDLRIVSTAVSTNLGRKPA